MSIPNFTQQIHQMKLRTRAMQIAGLFVMVTIGVLAFSNTAQARVSNWDAGNIISDGIFTNANTMSPSDIQTFLNSKVSNCDTWGTQTSEFGGGTRRQWAESRGYSAPFTCLKDYSDGGVSAAQLIYNTAQKYSINPQVLIVLLQKEQSLVTDTWPLSLQYRSATGYGCPDTAACDTQYYGFKNQIDWSAKMFRAIMNASPTWYTPYLVGNNYIRYSPDSSCGGSNVNIQNRATQALYNYTPYQPNEGALNTDWGTAGCGAYGNRNFYLYFTSWFGDTRIFVTGTVLQRYTALGGEGGVLGKVMMNNICGLPGGGCYQGFQNGGIYSSGPGSYESYGVTRARYVAVGAEKSSLGYPTGSVQCGLSGNGCYQTYQNGVIYYSPAVGTAYEVKSGAILQKYTAMGSENSTLGYPTGPAVCGLVGGGCYQGFQNGSIYWSPATGAFENNGVIRQLYAILGTEYGPLGYPTSSIATGLKNGGSYQQFQNGAIYWTSGTGAHYISQPYFNTWDQTGKEWGALGFPTTEKDYNTNSQSFEGGKIYETPTSGNKTILNTVASRWQEIGGASGKLGYPTTNTVCGIKDDGCYQLFKDGNTIYYSPATGAKTVWGAIYTKWDQTGKEWGALGFPTSNEYYNGSIAQQDFQGGTIYWSSTQGASFTTR